MAAGIGNETVGLFGRIRNLFAWPVLIVGVDSTGKLILPIVVGAGGGIVPGVPVGTYVEFHVANSGSTTIPTTAKRWGVNFVGTGTANTFGSNTSLTGGQSFSDNAVPASAIAIACDTSTVADGFYSTT